MHILYARMPGYDWVSTPSDAVVREIQKLGHEVTVMDSTLDTPYDDYNIVFSPYESVTLLGDALSKKFNIPHIAHIEWLPPWRIQNVKPEEYGFEKNDPELDQLKSKQEHYQRVGQAWLNADCRSICAHAMVPMHTNFLGKFKTLIRYPSIDYESLMKAKEMWPKVPKVKNRILTVARCVPNKRYDLLINAVNKIKTEGTIWRIVGDGPLMQNIPKMVTNKNVKVEIVGACWGWARVREEMEATLALGGFTGMTPLECTFFNTFPILYCPPSTSELNMPELFKEMFNGYLTIAETPEGVADQIDSCFAQKSMLAACAQITNECVDGKLGVTSSQQNAFDLIERFKAVV